MPRRRPHTPFVLTTLAVLALAPIPVAFSETLADVQDRVERTSAELAQVRTRAESDTGAAQAAAVGSGRDLERSKSELIDRENVLTKEAVRAAKAAAAQAAATEAQLASGASTASLVPHASDAFGSGLAATKGIASLASLPAAPAATSGVDAAALDAYLVGTGSPLAGTGAAFVASAGQVGLDPRVLVAISGAETSFATYGPSQLIHNPFGMGPGRVYASWDEAIAAAANNLAGPLYLGAGKTTIGQISGTWAPLGAVNDPNNLNANWTRNVSRYYAEMGGDPASSIFSSSSLAPGPPGSVIGTQVATEALTHLGKPYVWGGESPATGFDCSGLVKYLYGQHGVALPRVADAQARVGTSIPPSALQSGDAVFFADSSGYIGHEGLYLGNGQFVHAPHSGDVVKVSSLLEPGYSARYAGARRYA